jgi:hypothetical protein
MVFLRRSEAPAESLLRESRLKRGLAWLRGRAAHDQLDRQALVRRRFAVGQPVEDRARGAFCELHHKMK